MAREKNAVSPKERNEKIIKMLKERRSVRISEFQEYLGVSDMTVRRSLNEMAAEGLIKRVHGGAMAIDVVDDHSFQARTGTSRSPWRKRRSSIFLKTPASIWTRAAPVSPWRRNSAPAEKRALSSRTAFWFSRNCRDRRPSRR